MNTGRTLQEFAAEIEQRLPRHVAALASLRSEVEAARAEARFEQARKARREGRS